MKEDEEKIETNTHACVYVVDDVSLLHSCGNLQEDEIQRSKLCECIFKLWDLQL